MEEVSKQRKLELEEILLKKYKVSSEISTSSFDENNNEQIYDENHDHSIIDSVNDDCLAEIFMYVPVFERPKIALVCQKWNRVLDYSWGNVKKLELTHWEYNNESPNCLKKYPTPAEKLSFLNLMLDKCGCYLRQLDLTAYGHSDIVPVINEYCPNLVELRLRFTYDDHRLYWKSFSSLSKLKVLTVIFQHHLKHHAKLNELVHALEFLADTLTDLTLFNWEADEPCIDRFLPYLPCRFPADTIYVLRQLKALKRFEFGGILIFPKLREYLRYNGTLECHSYDNYSIENVKPNQLMSITRLNMLRYKVSDDTLYTVANTMKQLTTLKVNCKWITNDGVVAVSKINNLTHLYFSGFNDSIDSSSIKLLKNLTRLMLPRSNKITDNLAMKVLENSPKLEALFVLNTRVTVEFIKKAAEVSRKREKLLKLAVSFKTDEKQYESPYFRIRVVPECKKKEIR